MIDPDNEAQEAIDAEEAAAAAYADGEAEPDNEEPEIDPEEFRLLKVLEKKEREIARAEDIKKADADAHNEEIKDLKGHRDGLLAALTEYRLGQERLPLE